VRRGGDEDGDVGWGSTREDKIRSSYRFSKRFQISQTAPLAHILSIKYDARKYECRNRTRQTKIRARRPEE
jgi:hypothetical protein